MNRLVPIFVSTALALWVPGVFAVEYYVSSTGDDANPGSESQPFATLEAARDAVRKLRQRGQARIGRSHHLAAWWRLRAHARHWN